jgi:hypothetical protein
MVWRHCVEVVSGRKATIGHWSGRLIYSCGGSGSHIDRIQKGVYDRRLRTLNAFTGRLKPLRINSSVNSASALVSTALKTLMSMRICPFFASLQVWRRDLPPCPSLNTGIVPRIRRFQVLHSRARHAGRLDRRRRRRNHYQRWADVAARIPLYRPRKVFEESSLGHHLPRWGLPEFTVLQFDRQPSPDQQYSPGGSRLELLSNNGVSGSADAPVSTVEQTIEHQAAQAKAAGSSSSELPQVTVRKWAAT